jgi:hypothetical protein
MLKRVVAVGAVALAIAGCAKAPGKEQVQESLKRFIPVSFEVLEVTPLQEVPGLYQVVLRADKQPLVLYVDKKASYVISGTLMSLEPRKNLTMETQNKFLHK